MDHSKNTNYMQTAGRALEVLNCFNDGESHSLTAISEATGLSPSVVFRLLYTLTLHGFVKQLADSKEYCVGDKVVMLGMAGMQGRKIVRASHDLMLEWRLQTGHMIALLAVIDNQAVVLDRFNTLPDEKDVIYTGNAYPLHKGASQRLLLAYLSENERQEYVDTLFLERSAKNALLLDLDMIRSRGYDYTEGTMTNGIWGLSLPLFHKNGDIAASLSTGGRIDDRSREHIEERLEQLKQLAERIQKRFNTK